MSLEKVQSGQPMRIKADTFNSILDATRAYKERQQSGGRSSKPDAPRDPSTVLVRNDGSYDVPLGYGLYPTEPVFTPTDNESEFKFRPTISCDTTAGAESSDTFVVAMEPIAVGKTGLAVAAGVCPAKVYINNSLYRFVKMSTGLQSAATGGAQILWSESWAEGLRWTLLRMGFAEQDKQLPDGVLANMNYTTKSYGGVILPTWDFSVVF